MSRPAHSQLDDRIQDGQQDSERTCDVNLVRSVEQKTEPRACVRHNNDWIKPMVNFAGTNVQRISRETHERLKLGSQLVIRSAATHTATR